jgi:hypothetical protein
MKRGHNIPIAEHVNTTLKELAKKMGGGVVRVGFLEGAKYPSGVPVAYIAYLDEFGHGGNFPSPARPYFRTMVKETSHDWPAQMAHLIKLYDYNGHKVLNGMGGIIAGDLRESIENFNGVLLSPTTLVLRDRFWTNPQDITITDVLAAQEGAKKGAPAATGTQAKPLVWTGVMLRNVAFEVVKK